MSSEIVSANDVNLMSATSITTVRDDLINAAGCLNMASKCIRACYVAAASSNKDFQDLRGEVLNNAVVYRDKLLPMSKLVVQNMEMFFDNYTSLTFEQFKECIADVATEAKEYNNQAKFVAESHRGLMVAFKKAEDKVSNIVNKLGLEKINLENQAKHLTQDAAQKKKLASGVTFIPVVGVFASMFFSSQADDIETEAIAKLTESQLALAASEIIKGDLSNSLTGFVNAMEKISGFFSVLENETAIFATRADEAVEAPKNRHYLLLKNKAIEITGACKEFIKVIPISTANLDAIPKNYDGNYVSQWLKETHTKDENSKDISLLEWGKRIFPKNKKLLAILE